MPPSSHHQWNPPKLLTAWAGVFGPFGVPVVDSVLELQPGGQSWKDSRLPFFPAIFSRTYLWLHPDGREAGMWPQAWGSACRQNAGGWQDPESPSGDPTATCGGCCRGITPFQPLRGCCYFLLDLYQRLLHRKPRPLSEIGYFC